MFLWLFKVPEWFFTVPGEFLLFQVDFYGFSWFQVGIQRFSRIQFCFSWFQVGLRVINVSRLVFIGTGGLLMFFYGSRSGFHDSRWISIVINGPRLV